MATTVTRQDIQTAYADVKNTVSTKVEWSTSGSGSLKTLLGLIDTFIYERGIYTVNTLAEMQDLTNADTNFVAIWDVAASNGLYSWRTGGGTPDYTTSFPAADGGLWVLVTEDTPL